MKAEKIEQVFSAATFDYGKEVYIHRFENCKLPKVYAIIDLETTGGNSKSDRIIEIAILLHDGSKVTGQFHSLVNPECRIPYRIIGITGINNLMVENAPRFFEIAKQVVEFTEGKILIAHNARFDYQFLRNVYQSLGFDFKREQLCTLAMARALLPKQRSYSLGRLCDALEISFEQRHRALSDAEATARLFEHLSDLQSEDNLTDTFAPTRRMSLEAQHHKALIDSLPHQTGVYYFYNRARQLIYIGKSVDIRSRILSHFNNHSTAKAIEMRRQIDHIHFELTGSELVALLKESEEIKLHKPLFNRAQRRSVFKVGLFSETNQEGYLSFKVERLRANGKEPEIAFGNSREARSFVERLLDQHELCQKCCDIHRIKGPCFYYNIHKCRGACIGKESQVEYNLRAEKALQKIRYSSPNMLILGKGRHEGEKSLVGIENGKYLGFGFLEKEFMKNPIELLKASLQPKMDNKDVRQIIKLFLRQGKAEGIIHF